MCHGLRHGTGTYTCASNGVTYTGQWDEGKRHGKVWLTHACVRYLLVSETLCLTVPFFFLATGFTALQQGEDLMVRRRVGAQQEGGLGGEMVRTGVARQPSAAASLAKEKKKKR